MKKTVYSILAALLIVPSVVSAAYYGYPSIASFVDIVTQTLTASGAVSAGSVSATGAVSGGSVTSTTSVTATTTLKVGANGGGDSVALFYDDNDNTLRTIGWGDTANAWFVEDNAGATGYLWHSGNDGAGSGLDADTVDGYTPVNKAGDTMSGGLNFDVSATEKQLSFNTGSQYSYFYGNTIGVIGLYDFTNSRSAWNYSPSTDTVTIDTTNFKHYGNVVWTAGNDGSGSGLDADNLDGGAVLKGSCTWGGATLTAGQIGAACTASVTGAVSGAPCTAGGGANNGAIYACQAGAGVAYVQVMAGNLGVVHPGGTFNVVVFNP